MTIKTQKLKIDLSFLGDDSDNKIKHQKQNKKEEYVWTCDTCGKEFETQEEADEHEKKCSLESQNESPKEEYVWTCDTCGKEFETQEEADEHELICEKNTKNEEEVWTCDFCDKEFKTEKEADEHEKICEINSKKTESETSVYCIKCGAANPSNANFCKKCGNKIII